MYFCSPVQGLKDRKKQLDRERSNRNQTFLLNSETQGENSFNGDQELSKLSENRHSPKNDPKNVSQENRPINLLPSTSKNEKLKANLRDPERFSINITNSIQYGDHSLILRDSNNRVITKRSRIATISTDKVKERTYAVNCKLKPISNKKDLNEKIIEKNSILKPSNKSNETKTQSKTKFQNSKPISANRADIILQRNQDLVRKQNDSIARALREIGSFDKNTIDTKSREQISKKRESALIKESIISKDFSLFDQPEKDSPYNKQPKKLPNRDLLKKHYRHSSVPRKSSLERMKKDLGMPGRNEFSTRSMFNDNNSSGNEELKLFIRRNRILSSRTRENKERLQMNELINSSVRQIKREILLDDELFERFNQRSQRNRQSSLNHESINDVDKEIEKVEHLFHKNEDAYAHLVSIRGRLMDLYLANDYVHNKRVKGRSAQP